MRRALRRRPRGAMIEPLIAEDIADLLPAIEKDAEERLAKVRRQLAQRAEDEAKSLQRLLEDQRDRIGKASRDADRDDPNQFVLPGVLDEERRERAADRRHWKNRLERLEREIVEEPARVRASYEVRAHRLEPVGLVYLWPSFGLIHGCRNHSRSRLRVARPRPADRPRRRKDRSAKNLGLVAERQTQVQSAEVAAQLRTNDRRPGAAATLGRSCKSILGWEPHLVAGAPGGPPIPERTSSFVCRNTTRPSRRTGRCASSAPDGPPLQLLVRIEDGVDLDKRGALGGWEATPHQRFERLLRETAD